MKLGIFNCVVVSSEKDLREVLITKGDHFDGRPDWRRFDLMFGGTRRNGGFLYQHKSFLMTNIYFSHCLL